MACPFMDLADVRCADHFSLNRLAEAFNDCLGQSRLCPTYYRLMRERPVQLDLPWGAAAPRSSGSEAVRVPA